MVYKVAPIHTNHVSTLSHHGLHGAETNQAEEAQEDEHPNMGAAPTSYQATRYVRHAVGSGQRTVQALEQVLQRSRRGSRREDIRSTFPPSALDRLCRRARLPEKGCKCLQNPTLVEKSRLITALCCDIVLFERRSDPLVEPSVLKRLAHVVL